LNSIVLNLLWIVCNIWTFGGCYKYQSFSEKTCHPP